MMMPDDREGFGNIRQTLDHRPRPPCPLPPRWLLNQIPLMMIGVTAVITVCQEHRPSALALPRLQLLRLLHCTRSTRCLTKTSHPRSSASLGGIVDLAFGYSANRWRGGFRLAYAVHVCGQCDCIYIYIRLQRHSTIQEGESERGRWWEGLYSRTG